MSFSNVIYKNTMDEWLKIYILFPLRQFAFDFCQNHDKTKAKLISVLILYESSMALYSSTKELRKICERIAQKVKANRYVTKFCPVFSLCIAKITISQYNFFGRIFGNSLPCPDNLRSNCGALAPPYMKYRGSKLGSWLEPRWLADSFKWFAHAYFTSSVSSSHRFRTTKLEQTSCRQHLSTFDKEKCGVSFQFLVLRNIRNLPCFTCYVLL